MKNKTLFFFCLLIMTLPVLAQRADMSLIPYRQGNLWGYATPDKKIVIKPVYQDANTFHNGYASVEKGNRYGYINKAGKLVIPFRFFAAKPFRIGYTDNLKKHTTDTVLYAAAVFTQGGIEKCINIRGMEMGKSPAINEDNAPINAKPLLKDSISSSFSTMRKSETFDKVLDQYHLPSSEDDYYIAVKDDKYGIINNKFEKILPFEYSFISKLVINNTVYLLATKAGKRGVFMGNGSVFLDVENDRTDYILDNENRSYFIVSKGGNTGLLNIGLQELIALKYTDIQYDHSGGFILTGKDNLKGVYFLNNKIIEPKYADLILVNAGNFARVKTAAGKSGYVNSEGVEFFED